ncbi:MAG: hypothetical protein PHY47_15950 [Lachnospiraceae bacterium]|nr:hypothetical protein [Lachnospiraceae bacterium]
MLKLDYKDDVLNEEVNTERKYEITKRADGYDRISDMTSYKTIGDEVGGAELKEMVRSLYDFKNSNVSFNDDGSVTEVLDIGTKITKFNTDGSITEIITDLEGNMITKDTVFNEDGTITSTVGDVVKA